MELWLAPLEGITGYLFRQCMMDIFPADYSFVTPFLSPASEHKFPTRERNEILPEHNKGLNVVPQIICHNIDDAFWAIEHIGSQGYQEVNLNLGCPSGTVTAKKKGSGFLRYPELLDQFFYEIFDRLEKSESVQKPLFSVKTRIGYESEDEFPQILDIYNKYPISRIIIHPRLRSDFYKGMPRFHIFDYAVNHTDHKICYNGNIFRAGDVAELRHRFPSVDSYMIGRAGVASPWIFQELCEGQEKSENELVLALKTFHDRILDEYMEYMASERNTLFKMKELWVYWGCHFPEAEKLKKAIRKAQHLSEYRQLVNNIFSKEKFVKDAIPEYK